MKKIKRSIFLCVFLIFAIFLGKETVNAQITKDTVNGWFVEKIFGSPELLKMRMCDTAHEGRKAMVFRWKAKNNNDGVRIKKNFQNILVDFVLQPHI